MGVRISLYAVNIPQFESFIAQSIKTVLWYYANYGTDTKRNLAFYRWEYNQRITYCSSPGFGASILQNREKIELTEQSVTPDSFLATKTRDFLRHEDSFALERLLSCLSSCPSANCVRQVSVGRRWWIGSFLDCAQTTTKATPQEYATIETLFQKILRGYNCGKALSQQYYEVTDFDFPVIPTDDTDLWMGVWTDSETACVIQFIRSLMQVHNLTFRKPPSLTRLAPETDEQWNEWVRQMIKQLCQVETFNFDQLYIVSFIDS